MRISVTARHMDISEAVKDYAAEKVEKLPKLFDKVVSADVVLDAADNGHSAELILHQDRGPRIVAESKHADMYAAIDDVIDRMEHQLRKKKDILKNKRRKE